MLVSKNINLNTSLNCWMILLSFDTIILISCTKEEIIRSLGPDLVKKIP